MLIGDQDAAPDVIAGVAKQLETTTGNSESGFGYGITGRGKTFGRDDLRFQFHGGNTGRYVGATATDLIGEEAEETTAIMVAYRHFWSETLRSKMFYGNTETDESDRERPH